MSIPQDDPFDLVPLAPPESAAIPGEIARGPGWIVTRDGDCYRLEYLTGELVDHARTIEITAREAEQLAAGQRDVQDVVVTHQNVAALIERKL